MIGAAPRVASWHWLGWALALLAPIGRAGYAREGASVRSADLHARGALRRHVRRQCPRRHAGRRDRHRRRAQRRRAGAAAVTRLLHDLRILGAARPAHAHRPAGTANDRRGLERARRATRRGGLSEAVRTLHQAGLLHDVGKIGVPDAILNKTRAAHRRGVRDHEGPSATRTGSRARAFRCSGAFSPSPTSTMR